MGVSGAYGATSLAARPACLGPPSTPSLSVRVFGMEEKAGITRALIRGCTEAAGELIARQDEFAGLESAPGAFVDLLAGGNVGTRSLTLTVAN